MDITVITELRVATDDDRHDVLAASSCASLFCQFDIFFNNVSHLIL